MSSGREFVARATTAHCTDSWLPGASERLSEPMQLKPYILFSRRITRGAVRRVRNSRAEGRESFLLETRVDQIRATPFIKSRALVLPIETEHGEEWQKPMHFLREKKKKKLTID